MKHRIATLLFFIAVTSLFGGCTALQEAQQKREARLLEERTANTLMLAPSDANIQIAPGALFGESDHYTLTFNEDLPVLAAFDTETERHTFALSALGYMESLYDAMNDSSAFNRNIRFT